MRNVFFLLFVFVAFRGFSQQQVGTPDSLKRLLSTHAAEDSNRVLILIKLANATFTYDPAEAMQYAREAAAISGKINWQKGQAMAFRSTGGICLVQSDYVGALDNFQKALTADNGKSQLFEASVLNNMAIVYSSLKQFDKALEYQKRHFVIVRALDNREELTMSYCNVGTIYQQLGKYDSALSYYDKSLALSRETGNKRLESNALCVLGSLFKETGDYRKSVFFSAQSVELATTSGNIYVKAPALNNWAWALVYLSEYGKAEQLSKESLRLAKEMGSVQWEYESWESLYANYEKQHKLAQALAAYKQFILLRDSVTNDEKRQEVVRKEMQFQAEKKEALLQAAHAAALHRQGIIRNAWIGIAAILLLGGATSFLFYKRRRDAVTRQHEAELKAEITSTEMKALRAQMNPHFIFNSLNSISDYIGKNNIQAADKYLVKFARLMRMILEHSGHKEVSLSDDLKALELYMQLEALRMDHRFDYEIIVDESVDVDNTLVPPLLLQPFVENSIWHGLRQKTGHGKLYIRILREGDHILCVVEDNGVGISKDIGTKEAEQQEKQSLGIKITTDRIAMINKKQLACDSVQVVGLSQGTRVNVKIPLQQKF
ncbi:MAG: tetratricopeptide repeat protein [Niastella sp.]|nr:tetratricopeptide repeat protein [Niastella sp.]